MMVWRFPNVKPVKLKEVAELILNEIPERPLSLREKRAKGVDFEKLLRRIQETPAEKMHELTADLLVPEVDTLCYRFWEIPQNTPAKTRALSILTARHKSRYTQEAWNQFQTHYKDQELVQLAALGLKKGPVRGLSETLRAHLAGFLHQENPLDLLTMYLSHKKQPWENILKELQITGGSPLERELLRGYMLTADPGQYSAVNTLAFMLETFSFMEGEHPKDYLQMIERYLLLMNEEKYNTNLMDHMLRSLGDPREPVSRWDSVSKESRARFLWWLNFRIMSDFFAEAGDNERFTFWRQFSHLLDEARCIKIRDSGVAFLVFENVFVVEFARVGNAAYVYPRQYYEEKFKPYAAGQEPVRHESLLKDDTNLFRILHGGAWQYRYYPRVAKHVERSKR